MEEGVRLFFFLCTCIRISHLVIVIVIPEIQIETTNLVSKNRNYICVFKVSLSLFILSSKINFGYTIIGLSTEKFD